MNYADFTKLIANAPSPVLLLEGTRELPAQQAPYLTRLAAHLAATFPHARFRTGNAKGSDKAFADGIAASRLEFMLPHASHRARERPAESAAVAIDDISSARVQEVVDATLRASPQYERVAVNYSRRKTHPRQRAIAQLILRDTLKVTGIDAFSPPIAGIFYVHASDPDRGGTGHTMRVCRARGVPVIDQFCWLEWLSETRGIC